MDYGDLPGHAVGFHRLMGSIPGWATKTLHAMYKKKRVLGLWKPLKAQCSTISFLLKSCQVDFTVKRS